MSVAFDKTQWDKALLEIAKETKGTLADLCNKRLFYVCVRCFAALDPKDPQGKRDSNRNYLERVISTIYRAGDVIAIRFTKSGRVIGKGKANALEKKRSFRVVHAIAQARRIKRGEKALNPRVEKSGFDDKMKAETGPIRRSAVNAVGYLKGAVARAASSLSRANGFKPFNQFGFEARKKKGVIVRAESKGNGFLQSIAQQYGLVKGNVGIHKHVRSKATAAKGSSWNPVAEVAFSFGVHEQGKAGAEARYNVALARAFQDELAEMHRHIEARISAVAADHNP